MKELYWYLLEWYGSGQVYCEWTSVLAEVMHVFLEFAWTGSGIV